MCTTFLQVAAAERARQSGRPASSTRPRSGPCPGAPRCPAHRGPRRAASGRRACATGRDRRSRCRGAAASASMASRMCLRDIALVPRLAAHLADALGGEDEAGTLALQPRADDLLRAARGLAAAAQRIDVRRVDEVDSARRPLHPGWPCFEARRTEGRRSSCPGKAETCSPVLPKRVCCMLCPPGIAVAARSGGRPAIAQLPPGSERRACRAGLRRRRKLSNVPR